MKPAWPVRLLAGALTAATLACGLGQTSSSPAPPSPPTASLTATAPAAASTAVPIVQPATATLAPSPTWLPREHYIGIRQVAGVAEFFDRRGGGRFVPRGVNHAFVPAGGRFVNTPLEVGLYDPAFTRAEFGRLAALGYNTVRVFFDHCRNDVGCIARPGLDGLNPAYLDNFADMLAAARETGVFILFTSNDLPDHGGYSQEANDLSGDNFAGYRNSFYLTPPAVAATRRYWRDVLTGLLARRAPLEMVLGWQLLNEQWMFADQPPLSLASGLVETTTSTYDMADPEQKRRMVAEGLIYYIAEVRAEILAHDPTALVTMGFFAPEMADPAWYVDTAPLLAGSDLDFFDFHAYPGHHELARHAELFGMLGYEAKPILLGEYGAFRHIYSELPAAARALSAWVVESCALGFDGWLHWTHYPYNADVGDLTWGFTDEDGFLMNLFAPANQPDPCLPVEVPSANLAFGKPVRFSNALAAEPAAGAVDENEATLWGAGQHPPEWIEVDLGAPYRITEVRLLVSQYPEGATTHQLHVRAEADTAGSGTLAHTFSGPTRDQDWLIFTPPVPLENVRYLRVTTIASPSWVAWREVQVFGEPATP